MFDATERASIRARRMEAYRPNMPPTSKLKEAGIHTVIDLATNENHFGIPECLSEAILAEARDNLNHYPESSCLDLRVLLAEKHNVTADQILIDNGLDAVIGLLGRTFLDETDEIVTASATFPAYKHIADIIGATTVEIPLAADYQLNLEAILNACNRKTKAIFLCNPNNPTGTFFNALEFRRLMENLPSQILTVVDEAFADFADAPDFPDTVSLLPRYSNLVILKSFSKGYPMAGLRIGYAIADAEIIDMMMRIREPFPVNRLAVAAGIAALNHPQEFTRVREENKRIREQTIDRIKAMGFDTTQSQANFLFVDLKRPVTPVLEQLLSKGIVLRNLSSFGYPTAVRMCLGPERWIDTTLTELERIAKHPVK